MWQVAGEEMLRKEEEVGRQESQASGGAWNVWRKRKGSAECGQAGERASSGDGQHSETLGWHVLLSFISPFPPPSLPPLLWSKKDGDFFPISKMIHFQVVFFLFQGYPVSPNSKSHILKDLYLKSVLQVTISIITVA